ncbi:MAG: ATP-binding cassette domain-containing protein [Pseudomonadota bacterium]
MGSENEDMETANRAPTWCLSIIACLHQLCRHAKIEASPQRITAGLPLVEGDLPANAVPIAAARVGLEANALANKPIKLRAEDCPALVPLKDAKAALIISVNEKDFTLWTPDGAAVLPRSEVAEQVEGQAYSFHVRASAIDDALAEDEAVDAHPKAAWRTLLSAFFRRKSLWVQLLAAGVIINLMALVLPLFLMAVYDRVVPNLAMETLWALGIGVLIAICFEFALKLIRQSLIEAVSLRISTELQHSAAERILRARPSDAPRQAGAALSGLKETDAVTNIVPSAILAACIDLPFFLLVLALIYSIAGVVAAAPALGALMLFGVGIWGNIGLMGAAKSGVKYQDARQNLLHDILEGLGHIKASLAEGQFLRHWDVISDEAAMASKRARFWGAFPGHASPLIMQLVTVGVIVLGVFQLKEGLISVGAMVACTLLSNRAMVPISTVNGLASRALQSLASFRSVFHLLRLPQERSISAAGVGASRLRGQIRTTNVAMAYQAEQKPTLSDVNLTINPGESIAIVGPSGAGKTSLLTLLAGQVPPSQGDVFVDGFHLAQYGVNDYRRHVGFAPQDARIFNLTLKDNILLGVQSVSSQALVQALNVSGLASFVAQQEEGLALKVGPNGERLSGGQRQAVLLARALIHDPAILLLDEPTSAMDSAAEQNVVRGLRDFINGRTTLISTHRTPLLSLADRIIWMEGGRIVGDGPRQEMIARIQGKKPAA